MPNASRSYYSDCCHITSTGATFYRSEWIKGLLEYNPVVTQWLLQDPPDPPVPVNSRAVSRSDAYAITCSYGSNGISIGFSLPAAGRVSVGLFSVDGKTIVPMTERTCVAGHNSMRLDAAASLTPGAYIVRLNNGTTVQSLNMTTIVK